MKSRMTKFYTGLGALLLGLGLSEVTLAQQSPRNIILIIGDGMGLHQVSASYLHQTRREPSEPWHMARFPFIGLASTVASDALITDSGAGATALSTGRSGASRQNKNTHTRLTSNPAIIAPVSCPY